MKNEKLNSILSQLNVTQQALKSVTSQIKELLTEKEKPDNFVQELEELVDHSIKKNTALNGDLFVKYDLKLNKFYDVQWVILDLNTHNITKCSAYNNHIKIKNDSYVFAKNSYSDDYVHLLTVKPDFRKSKAKVRLASQKTFEYHLKNLQDNTEYIFSPGEFEIKQTYQIVGKNITFRAENKYETVFMHDGYTRVFSWFNFDKNCEDITFDGFTFDSKRKEAGGRDILGACLSLAGKRLFIKNNHIKECGFFILGNQKPEKVVVENNISPDANVIRQYFAWIEGEEWIIRNNNITNSEEEHIVRGPASWVKLHNNIFSNLQTGALENNILDYSKGNYWGLAGRYLSITNNTFKSEASADGEGWSVSVSICPYANTKVANAKTDQIYMFDVSNNSFYGRGQIQVCRGTYIGRISNNSLVATDLIYKNLNTNQRENLKNQLKNHAVPFVKFDLVRHQSFTTLNSTDDILTTLDTHEDFEYGILPQKIIVENNSQDFVLYGTDNISNSYLQQWKTKTN